MGVAFLVKVEGKTIYHAGDLNWWHWNGEPEEDNEYYKKTFQDEMKYLEGKKIDLAFMLLDPRQEDKYCWGMNYFLEHTDSKVVFPMHCFEHYKINHHYLNCEDGRLRYIDGKSDWIDLRAAEEVELKAGEFKLIHLGVAMQLPEGYEAHIVPRSSTFKNFGIIQTNHCGVIDESYCGPNDWFYMPAYALRDTVIHVNDRICQFRIEKHQPTIQFEEVDRLNGEDRGGIGSTGKR